jgi:hypothetical protein
MRSLIVTFLALPFYGCATATETKAATALGAAADTTVTLSLDGVRTSIERVVFDEDPTAQHMRITGPSAVTVGWRIVVAHADRRGKTARTVEWVYQDVPADVVDDETAPPRQVTERAQLLAERLGAQLPTGAALATR